MSYTFYCLVYFDMNSGRQTYRRYTVSGTRYTGFIGHRVPDTRYQKKAASSLRAAPKLAVLVYVSFLIVDKLV